MIQQEQHSFTFDATTTVEIPKNRMELLSIYYKADKINDPLLTEALLSTLFKYIDEKAVELFDTKGMRQKSKLFFTELFLCYNKREMKRDDDHFRAIVKKHEMFDLTDTFNDYERKGLIKVNKLNGRHISYQFIKEIK